MNKSKNVKIPHEIVISEYFDLETSLAEASLFESKCAHSSCKDIFKIIGQEINQNVSNEDEVEKNKGSDVNIPLWSIQSLEKYVSMYTPEWYKVEALETIKADPNIVPVADTHRYYYTVGKSLARFSHDSESKRILKQLHFLFRERIEGLLKSSQGTNEPMRHALVKQEKIFFNISRKTYQNIVNWWRYQNQSDSKKRKIIS
uniref:DNA replication complex GINS protein PSF3 n=1 Tax=Parastrongyloides trichosuri TaxID=131310 RepID=A0A0N5A591_PARTI